MALQNPDGELDKNTKMIGFLTRKTGWPARCWMRLGPDDPAPCGIPAGVG